MVVRFISKWVSLIAPLYPAGPSAKCLFANTPPTAVITYDGNQLEADDTTTLTGDNALQVQHDGDPLTNTVQLILDGSNSSDPNGTAINSHQWYQSDIGEPFSQATGIINVQSLSITLDSDIRIWLRVNSDNKDQPLSFQKA